MVIQIILVMSAEPFYDKIDFQDHVYYEIKCVIISATFTFCRKLSHWLSSTAPIITQGMFLLANLNDKYLITLNINKLITVRSIKLYKLFMEYNAIISFVKNVNW